MKVIVQKSTKGLGKAGDIIELSDGYVVNYLLPHKIVLPAYQGNEKVVQENIRQATHKQALIKQKAVALAQKIKQQTFTLAVKAANKGKIFGSITHLQIAKAVNEQYKEIELGHDQVILKAPMTTLGEHTIVLKLHPDVQTEVTLEVKAS